MDDDAGVRKKELRRYFRQRRAEVAPAELASLSCQVVDRALRFLVDRSDFFRIASYSSLHGEVSTVSFNQAIQKLGRTLLLPHVSSPSHMNFAIVTSLTRLCIGAYGTLVPAADMQRCDKPDVVFVPGLAFDRMGNRLGMGKGYYDRYFRELCHSMPLKIGLTLNRYVLDEMPSDSWDVPMDMIMTETEIIGGTTWT
ncbi:5-formyltetrahydrofolate cyclo-ligase [Chrysiogenes arsenatis]|uniref:5-formyltetrahydrofolate cyclo-ligase n=1 Tax=Chrysiogenes arsenatis TaxID=309797 RepID=UPI000684B0A4|nr:5-formyltetrahydrofolate cyclo-ligase [Chrysiogenes arsenatis]